MFIEAQGYPLKENILFQDNQSAIKIIKNGRRSSGQKTRHMDIRYMWYKDRLESEKIRVKYCPTESMLADFFTKPLQGRLFRKLRAVVMGYEHIDTLYDTEEDAPEQERVGKDVSGEDLNSPEGITSGNGKEIMDDSNHDNETKEDTSVKSKDLSWADVVRKN